MRVVFDTNVLISALITTGKPRELFQMAAKRKIQLITSKEILKEFTEVASDPRIKKYADQQDVIAFLKIIDTAAKITKIKSQFTAIDEDPDDDVVLRTAVDGKANYIASGDKHLLSKGTFKGIRILTVDETLKLLKQEHRKK